MPGEDAGARSVTSAVVLPRHDEVAVVVNGYGIELHAGGECVDLELSWQEMQRAFDTVHAPIAMSGTVLAKVDAGYGAIEPGDLLTVFPTRGHAMRSEDAEPGTIVGKALQALEAGVGMILVLVMLR